MNGIRAKLDKIAGSTGFHSKKPQPYLVILMAVTYPDPDHSTSEQRFITVGVSSAGQVLIVAHVDRNENVRIISARKTTKRERKHYEEKN